jgi:hypothetical protein
MSTSDKLPIVEQIRCAASSREIAAIILRLPDAVLLAHGEVLMAECRKARFTEGAQFILMRQVAMDAVRDRAGRLPDAASLPLENWRVALAAFSQSSPQ